MKESLDSLGSSPTCLFDVGVRVTGREVTACSAVSQLAAVTHCEAMEKHSLGGHSENFQYSIHCHIFLSCNLHKQHTELLKKQYKT